MITSCFRVLVLRLRVWIYLPRFSSLFRFVCCRGLGVLWYSMYGSQGGRVSGALGLMCGIWGMGTHRFGF